MFDKLKNFLVPSIKTPLQRFAQNATFTAHMTPDILPLEENWCQHLFVYDEMMTNHRKNDLLYNHAEKIADAFTVRDYEMYKKHLGAETFAVVRETQERGMTESNYGPARIRGEVYAIQPHLFVDLDNYKQNTLECVRKRVRIAVHHKKLIQAPVMTKPVLTGVMVEIVEAWMYIGSNYWDDHIDAGPRRSGRFFSPVHVYVPAVRNVPDHYHFTIREYFNK